MCLKLLIYVPVTNFPYHYEFIREVALKTGIILDPVYTGKAVRGMLEELAKNPTRFRGRRILFLHTGGAFGTFDGRLDKMLCTPGLPSNQCHVWTELDSPPF
ncbi:Bifunctional D-cysteine desulfhydrase/1-aminocyclopropane-1-carboxylate deaminase, mitochondrial [Lamellibrachia satsuma]|nr:Bifunctional D-cysteine desulfhydrase/1-aminocyclopropane-1-carboxylate deaminase, mitochondrial [Lamellibrachia satsuma]